MAPAARADRGDSSLVLILGTVEEDPVVDPGKLEVEGIVGPVWVELMEVVVAVDPSDGVGM